MKSRATVVLIAIAAIALIPAAGLALTPYSQDFEALSQPDTGALAADGWLVYGNVSESDGTYVYGYGAFPAPNDGLAFCQIAVGEGGDDQGDQQLSVFNDYENIDHAAGRLIESNVFQEQVISPADIDQIWAFDFQAKMGNLEGGSTAVAFIKTLDPGNGYALTNFITADMTSIPETWGGYHLAIGIDLDLVGQILQIGFASVATDYEGAGIFYDNIVFENIGVVAAPDAPAAEGVTLHQNYPNPFNPRTQIDFVLEWSGPVDVAVFDVAGRRVATLLRETLPAGSHTVAWDGRTANGGIAPAGLYRCVLTAAAGRASRSMVLVK